MKFIPLFLISIISFLSACSNEPAPAKTQTAPKSQSKMAWKQNKTIRNTQIIVATLDKNNLISVKANALNHQTLEFNDIPFKVGVYPIGESLVEVGDGLVGASFTIDISEDSIGKAVTPDYCQYISIKDDDKDNNHFAITYVDTSRGIASGKFKMIVKKQDSEQCGEKNPSEIAFTSGEFALKLEQK